MFQFSQHQEEPIELETFVLGTFNEEDDIHSMDEYYRIYSIYAGDPDSIQVGKRKSIPIPVRWGSIVDMYVFTYLFHIPIQIYDLKLFQQKKQQWETCSIRFYKRAKLLPETYIQPFQVFGLSFYPTRNIYDTMHILYGGKKKVARNHYSLLIKKE
jgi:hypothetical protein